MRSRSRYNFKGKKMVHVKKTTAQLLVIFLLISPSCKKSEVPLQSIPCSSEDWPICLKGEWIETEHSSGFNEPFKKSEEPTVKVLEMSGDYREMKQTNSINCNGIYSLNTKDSLLTLTTNCGVVTYKIFELDKNTKLTMGRLGRHGYALTRHKKK